MGLKKIVGRAGNDSGHAAVAQTIGMSVFFALGMAGGYCYAVSCGENAMLELSAYLDGYCALYTDGAVQTVSFLAVLRLYFFAVVLAYLLGFSKIGVFALPLVSAAYGFVMTFSVACFLRVYGRAGIWPALATFGPRAAVTIPCFLWVAAYSWSVVCGPAFVSRGKRCAPVRRDGTYYYRLCLCVVLLMAGACAERYLVPYLFRFAVSRL